VIDPNQVSRVVPLPVDRAVHLVEVDFGWLCFRVGFIESLPFPSVILTNAAESCLDPKIVGRETFDTKIII
jgi:hypothetical protein